MPYLSTKFDANRLSKHTNKQTLSHLAAQWTTQSQAEQIF